MLCYKHDIMYDHTTECPLCENNTLESKARNWLEILFVHILLMYVAHFVVLNFVVPVFTHMSKFIHKLCHRLG